MSDTKNKLTDVVTDWLLRIEDNFTVSDGPIKYVESITVSAGDYVEYDITTLFTEHDSFDLRSTDVKVLMQDEEPNSPSFGYWIESATYVTTGVNKAGKVRIHNHSASAVTLNITLNVPTAPPEPSQLGKTYWLGEVSRHDFITGPELATAMSFDEGILHNHDTDWLCFKIDGKTIYTTKRTVRYNISWDQLNNADLMVGNRTVIVKGRTYKVRLFHGTNLDTLEIPAPVDPHNSPMTWGSEWNRTMYHISGKPFRDHRTTLEAEGIEEGDWAQYSEEEIETRTYTNDAIHGGITICQQLAAGGGVSRGGTGVSGIQKYSKNNPSYIFGWRPVLELVE